MDTGVDHWMAAFRQLPPASQTALRQWFATQELIIAHSGQSARAWYTRLQWAMAHPGDYSFIDDFPAPDPKAEDSTERGDATQQARAFVGGDASWQAPATQGIQDKARSERGLEQELFARFMAGRLGGKR